MVLSDLVSPPLDYCELDRAEPVDDGQHLTAAESLERPRFLRRLRSGRSRKDHRAGSISLFLACYSLPFRAVRCVLSPPLDALSISARRCFNSCAAFRSAER